MLLNVNTLPLEICMNIVYTFEIMHPEQSEFEQLAYQVDEVFESTENMPIETRIGIVAFRLVDVINDERLAQDDVMKGRINRDADARKRARPFRTFFSQMFFPMLPYMGGYPGYYFDPRMGVQAPNEEVVIVDPPAELTDTSDPLEDAKMMLFNVKSELTDIYNLSIKEAREAEALARKLKFEDE